MTIHQLLIQAVKTARDMPEARPETVAAAVLKDAGLTGQALPPEVAEAVRNLREYLENTDIHPDYEAMWAVVGFLEAAQGGFPRET